MLEATQPRNDNQGVILPVDSNGVNWRGWYSLKGNGGDGVGTTQDRDGPKDTGRRNR
jgi:hypothetical protein